MIVGSKRQDKDHPYLFEIYVLLHFIRKHVTNDFMPLPCLKWKSLSVTQHIRICSSVIRLTDFCKQIKHRAKWGDAAITTISMGKKVETVFNATKIKQVICIIPIIFRNMICAAVHAFLALSPTARLSFHYFCVSRSRTAWFWRFNKSEIRWKYSVLSQRHTH